MKLYKPYVEYYGVTRPSFAAVRQKRMLAEQRRKVGGEGGWEGLGLFCGVSAPFSGGLWGCFGGLQVHVCWPYIGFQFGL